MGKRSMLSKEARRRSESLNLMVTLNPCSRDEIEDCGSWDAMIYVGGLHREYAHGDLMEVTDAVGEAVVKALTDFSHEPGIA